MYPISLLFEALQTRHVDCILFWVISWTFYNMAISIVFCQMQPLSQLYSQQLLKILPYYTHAKILVI